MNSILVIAQDVTISSFLRRQESGLNLKTISAKYEI